MFFFDEVFLKLLNISITASWLVIAVLVFRFLFKKAPKWINCCLWALVAIRLVCPFSFESVMSLVPSSEVISAETFYYSEAPSVQSGIEMFDSAVNPVISESLAPDPSGSVNPTQVLGFVLGVVWLIGFAAMLLYALISYLKLKNKVSTAIPLKENQWICDEVKSPFILGFLRPKIYLPSDIGEETMSLVIAHEKAHLKRKDHWWKPLGFILLSVYWFNPVMWLSYILLCRDIELACDEKVIKQMEGKDKKAYSEALLSCSAPQKMISACPVAFGEVGVKQRIKSVLNYKKPAFWVILVAVVASIVVAVCFLTDPKDENNGGNNSQENSFTWVCNPMLSATWWSRVTFTVPEGYEIVSADATSGTASVESLHYGESDGEKCVEWSPDFENMDSMTSADITVNALYGNEEKQFNVRITRQEKDSETGGTTFKIEPIDCNITKKGTAEEYVLEQKIISDLDSAVSQAILDVNSEIKPSVKDTLQEESGNADATVISPAQSGNTHESALKMCNISMIDYSSIPDDPDVFDDSMRFIECDEKACLLPEVIKTGTEGDFDYAIHEGGFAQILKYYGNESIVEIPEVIDNYPVSFIGALAFAEGDPLGDLKEKADCVIEKVVCPDTIVCIANDAFYGCRRLENIDFSKNLVCVGNLAFAHCEALKDIAFPGSLKVIGWSSFENIGITQVTIPSSLEYVGSGAFSDCKLLNKIDFQGGTVFFGSGIIEGSSVENLYIPANLTIVGDGGMFCSENLRKVEYAETMDQETIIYAEMFMGCYLLEEIILPSNVTQIGEYAFNGCYKLKEIHIPKSVKGIGKFAFMDCLSLNDVYFESANCDGLDEASLHGGYKRIYAPGGGNIEEFCNEHLLLQFVETGAP